MNLDTPRIAWEAGDDLAAIVARHGREAPGRAALVHGERTLTWAELDRRVDRVASALSASGSRPGDKVALLGENSIEYAEVFFGALRAGACVVPLTTMASTDSLSRMLSDSGARALIVSGAYRDVGAAIGGEAIALRVSLDAGAGHHELSYDAFLERGGSAPPAIPIGPDDAFDVIYSSGTTGVPKG